MAATIAAGETDADVYKALGDHDAVVVAGSNPVRLIHPSHPHSQKQP